RAELVLVTNGRAFRYQRKRKCTNRDDVNSERQLQQAKCNVQPTYRTVAKAGRKSAVDEHVHLHGAGGDHGGPNQREHSPDAFIAPLKIGVIFVTNAPERRELSS